eukprot:scaffold2162_cov398-Prasinococcus_capsulatus_cf.AAC.26
MSGSLTPLPAAHATPPLSSTLSLADVNWYSLRSDASGLPCSSPSSAGSPLPSACLPSPRPCSMSPADGCLDARTSSAPAWPPSE